MASLRERKYARTRLALVSAFQDALEQQPFSEVPIKALCHSVEVSEATFFNYFSSKANLLDYAIQFWLLELQLSLVNDMTEPGMRTIEKVYAFFARQCRARPGFMRAFMGWLANGGVLSTEMAPSILERQLAWPENGKAGTIQQLALDLLLVRQLEQAVNRSQLPSNVLMPTLLTGLISILFGAPLALLSSDPDRIGSMYQQQLQIFWAGIQAAVGGSAPQ